MNNFPAFNQFLIKMTFSGAVVDEALVDSVAKKMIDGLNLTVVKECSHFFPKMGLTKVYILSQSHLVIHTWPENSAIHIDLMTCSEEINDDMVKNSVRDIEVAQIEINRGK